MNMSSLVEVKPNPAIPALAPGDTVKVSAKIVEGDRERIQIFQGVVIKVRRNAQGGNFTVRRVAYGIGVERTFPLGSPLVEKVEVVRHGKVRRAKLYYLRGLTGKRARIAEKTDWDSAKKKAKDAKDAKDAENAGAAPEKVTEEKAPSKDVVKKEAKKKKKIEKIAVPETGKAEEVTEEVVAEATQAAEKEAAKEEKAKDDS